MQLTVERAKEILQKHTTEEHLFTHALAVSAAMGAMAEHFGGNAEHWKAIGYLHDVDYEKFPNEHCKHVRELLEPKGVDEKDIRTIISHGYGICTEEVQPETDIQKSLFAVDEMTGIVMASALMRPTGIVDLEVSSLKKKFKDKKFAAKCNREIIRHGAEMLDMPLETLMELTIAGMKTEAAGLGLLPRE